MHVGNDLSHKTHLGALLGNDSHSGATDISGTHTQNLEIPFAHFVYKVSDESKLCLSLWQLCSRRQYAKVTQATPRWEIFVLMLSTYSTVRFSSIVHEWILV
jgi:hypothetical protein